MICFCRTRIARIARICESLRPCYRPDGKHKYNVCVFCEFCDFCVQKEQIVAFSHEGFLFSHEIHETHEIASRYALAAIRIVILFLCEVINSSSENRICNHHKYSGASTLRKRAHRVARPFYITYGVGKIT